MFFVDDSVGGGGARSPRSSTNWAFAQARHQWPGSLDAVAGHRCPYPTDGAGYWWDEVRLILVDAKCRKWMAMSDQEHQRADPDFEGCRWSCTPSLSSEANRAMGKSVGVDTYVAKFDAEALADTLRPLIEP